MMSERPNIVLICVDQWRGDCLSALDHPVVQTPYLDQLTTEGATFLRAYSASPTCIPARAALLTGLSARNNGRTGYKDGVPWDYPVTIASEFTRQGYQTQAIGKMHVYPERSQMGFQNVILHDGYLHFARRRDRDISLVDDYIPWLREKTGDPRADYFDHGVNCNSQVARPWDKAEELHPTNFIVTQAADFLRRRDPRKPFFLYLGFHRPHPPYDPPAWAYEMYKDAEMPESPEGDWVNEVIAPHYTPHRPDPSAGKLSPAAHRRARAGYYGCMSHIDHQINRFYETLHEFRQRDNTYICFVSDHGELLGDHNLWRKSLPYEGSARIPFLLRGPSGSGIQPGKRISSEAVVELRDVMPTLLDCAGLEIPDGLDGRSVLPFARGESVQDWRPVLHGEHPWGGQSVQWLTDGREKYIWWSGTGREQLFQLENDPEERTDLARQPEYAERLTAWRSWLVETLEGREEGFVNEGKLVTGRPVRPVLTSVLGKV
ncbi:MAG: arylsulfatase [Armatimonadaceae bacterium]